MRFVPRKQLPHEAPAWVKSGALFFITIRGPGRAGSALTDPAAAAQLLDAVDHYHHSGRWHARLVVLMPDHVHALLAFPPAEPMEKAISDWKRYTASTAKIRWQRDFFDHRIRDEENWQLKAAYIRENPVRKNLCATASDWPWVYEAP